MPKTPTPAQIHAVQKVLYQPARTAKLDRLVQQVVRKMNLDPTETLAPGDVRVQAGSGPQWYYPDTRAVDQLVVEAAALCDQIAATLLELRADLAKVDVPTADRSHLLTAISETAATWTARGRIWKAPGAPGDPASAAAPITNHAAAAHAAALKVSRYLRTEA